MPTVLNILSVPVIMVFATGGTIGLIKLIKKVCPNKVDENGDFKETVVERKIREEQERKIKK